MKPRRIAFLFAMDAEAQPLIRRLGLVRDPETGDSRLPFEYYRGRYGEGFELLVGVSGKCPLHGVDNIGTEPAVLNAYVTLSRFKPDLCINAGTAGGFIRQGGTIGDVYVSAEAFRFHDRRVPLPGGFERYGVGHYPVAPLGGLAVAAGLKEGCVSTGNSLDCTPTDAAMIERNNASVKEMEAAGIAWVAHLLQVPFFALKSVTDLVDGPHATEKEFVENLDTASRRLQEKALAVLEHLSVNEGFWDGIRT